MSEAKHSPGPWAIGFGCGDQDEYFTIVDSDHEAVTDYSVANHDVAMSRSQMVANARLIAAAPDLLAACAAVVTTLAEYEGRVSKLDAAIDAARAAVAKATI